MDKCLFCELQERESSVLASNELAYAVLDIAPIRPGHALVIPRQHVEDFFELREEVQAAMLRLANDLSRALKDVCSPLRVGLLVTGFDVPHAHLHVVPVHDVHDITSRVVLDGLKVKASDEELQSMRDQLRARMDTILPERD